jgi:hypothetical protein
LLAAQLAGFQAGLSRCGTRKRTSAELQFEERRFQLAQSLSQLTPRCTLIYGDYAILHRPGPGLQIEQPTDEELRTQTQHILSASVRRIGDVRSYAIEYDREVLQLARMGWPRTVSSEGDLNCDVISHALANSPFSQLSDEAHILMAVPLPLLATRTTRGDTEENPDHLVKQDVDGRYYVLSNAR